MEIYYYGNHTPEGIYVDSLAHINLSILNGLLNRLDSFDKILIGINSEGIIVDNKLSDDDNYRILNIENEMNILKEEIQNRKINDDGNKDITSEFFILFDFLPEHIKKELKIYIK